MLPKARGQHPNKRWDFVFLVSICIFHKHAALLLMQPAGIRREGNDYAETTSVGVIIVVTTDFFFYSRGGYMHIIPGQHFTAGEYLS